MGFGAGFGAGFRALGSAGRSWHTSGLHGTVRTAAPRAGCSRSPRMGTDFPLHPSRWWWWCGTCCAAGMGLTVPSVGILPADTARDPGEVSGPPAARWRQGGFGHGAVLLLHARSAIGVNSSPTCSPALSSLRLHLSHRSAFEGDLLCVKAREGAYPNERVLVKGKFNFLYKAVVEAVSRAGAAEAVRRGLLAQIASAGPRPHSSQPRALMTFCFHGDVLRSSLTTPKHYRGLQAQGKPAAASSTPAPSLPASRDVVFLPRSQSGAGFWGPAGDTHGALGAG